jgi:hypothetical protein
VVAKVLRRGKFAFRRYPLKSVTANRISKQSSFAHTQRGLHKHREDRFLGAAERVRQEMGEQIAFMARHPRLCKRDGERLMAWILDHSMQFITPARAKKGQRPPA